MIIEIKKLTAKGKYEGDFSFEFTPPEDKLLVPLCRFVKSAKVEGRYELYDDDSVGVDFTLKYALEGQCSYCLERAERQIEYYSEVLFVADKNDNDNYYYDGIKVDLTAAVNDALIFSQPEVLLCKEGCQGIKIS